MSAREINIINYIVVCISEFAQRYQIHTKDAYLYLQKYRGIDFLVDCYDAEHTLSFDDTVDDLTKVCRRNGGALA